MERHLDAIQRRRIPRVVLLAYLHVGRATLVAEALDLLVLDGGAQCEASHELFKVDGLVAERRAHLARDEGALALDPGEIAVCRRQEEASDVWRRRHFDVLGDDAVGELIAELIHAQSRAGARFIRLVAEGFAHALRCVFVAIVSERVLGALHCRSILHADELKLVAQCVVALALDGSDLRVLVNHLAHLCQLIPPRVLQDIFGEHRLEAARHWLVGINLLAEVAEVRVLALEGDVNEALEELMELQALVAGLSALALDVVLVAAVPNQRVVDLVRAHKEQIDPRHHEVVRRELAIESEIRQLGRLQHHRGFGRARARGAALGILCKDGDQLGEAALHQAKGLLFPHREAVDVRKIHQLPRGDEPVMLLLLLALERLSELLKVISWRHGHAVVVNDGLLVAVHAPVVDHGNKLVEERHLIDLGVFDVAAQREKASELVKVDCFVAFDRLCRVAAREAVLAGGERVLDVQPREVHVPLGEDVALDLGRGLDRDVLTAGIALGELFLQHIVAHDLLAEDLAHANCSHVIPRTRNPVRVAVGIALVLHQLLLLRNDGLDLGVSLEGRLDQSDRVALCVGKDQVLEQLVESFGQHEPDWLVVAMLAQVGVLTEESARDERLEKLGECERLVARLRKVALHHGRLDLLYAVGREGE
mmetsp:Transcript_58186/g.115495  ORF Transcript_58186/g.115495 Transcript_58186/m.115495 type:complete len:651 (-) Transcript_58186:7-1959(-)